MACPALNSLGEPCRVPMRRDGPCYWHRGADVERHPPDGLPSLRRLPYTLDTLRQWAAEFDALTEEEAAPPGADDEQKLAPGGAEAHYTALQFVEWLELEAAPPAPPLPNDDGARLYRVVGAAALVVRG